MNKKLQIAGIISMIIGILWTIGIVTSILGIPLIISGIRLLKFSKLNNDDLLKYKKEIMGWAIFSIFFNLISSIILFIAYEDFDQNKKINVIKVEKKPLTENEKLNILLGVGVFLTVLSGLIFSTSNWNQINDITKTIMLLFLTGFFYLIYKISDKKIKIEKVYKTYYIIFLSFLSYSYISIGIFAHFGEFFSLKGDGAYLFLSSVWLLNLFLGYLLSKKIDKGIYISYLSLYVLVINICLYFKISFNIITIYAIILTLLIDYFIKNKDKNFKVYSNVISCIIPLIALISVLINYSDSLYNVILILFTITYLIRGILLKNKLFNILTPIMTPFLAMSLLNDFNFNDISKLIMFALIAFFINLSSLFNKKEYQITSLITTFLIITGCFMISFSFNNYLPLFMILILVSSYLFNKFFIKFDKIINYCLEPSLILTSIISIVYLFKDTNILTNFIITPYIVISLVAFSIMFICSKDKIQKYIYYYLTILFMIFSYFSCSLLHSFNNSTYEVNLLISNFIIIIIALLMYYFVSIKKTLNEKASIIISDIFFVLIIYFVINELSYIINNFLPIVGILGLSIINILNKLGNVKINKILLVIPLLSLSNKLIDFYELNFIIEKTIMFYALFMISYLFIKNQKKKNNFNIVGSIFIMLDMSFNESSVILIFSGIISILFILYGFYKKEHDDFYKLGIAFLVYNIIFNLSSLWSGLNIWLFLLGAGVVLITIVTLKLINKKD